MADNSIVVVGQFRKDFTGIYKVLSKDEGGFIVEYCDEDCEHYFRVFEGIIKDIIVEGPYEHGA